MSFETVTEAFKQIPNLFSSNEKEKEAEVKNTVPKPQPLPEAASDALNPDRIEHLTSLLQNMKAQVEQLIGNKAAAPAPASKPIDRDKEEKQERREKILSFLAYIPGLGTGATVFKEKGIEEKLKLITDPAEKEKFLKTLKKFRESALVRTGITVALAILFLAIAIFSGGVSASIGLILVGGTLALGSGFGGYYYNQLKDCKAKLKA